MSPEVKPFISVVVCAFNEEKLVQSCLQGLIKQSYPHMRYEVIVIDDASTDRTYSIAKDFLSTLAHDAPRIRLIRIKHGGLSIARNAGIRQSDGEIIAFIDGDAIADPIWLDELVQPFLKGADYVGGRINLLNTDSWVARFLQRTRNRQFFGPRIFNDQCIGCNMAFRKIVFETVGGFHENFISRGDESTLQKIIRDRFHYAPAPNATVLHERPDTIAFIVRVEWKAATLLSLCAKASRHKMHWKESILILEQFFTILFPILFCVIWFSPPICLFLLAISLLAVTRRFYLRPLNHAIAIGMIQNYGFLRGVVGHFIFCLAYNAISILGRAASPWIHRKAVIVAPMTTALTILKQIDSKQLM